jgi:signal transduction histidine kinase/HAMP domain-containing protein
MPEGIRNIILVAPDGTILFELNKGSDYRMNLFSSVLSSTFFSKTCERSFSSGETLFSDLEYYPPGTSDINGFICRPVINESGGSIGIAAIQITTEEIDKIIQYGITFGTTGQVYLIGLDLKIRSASRIGNNADILKVSEENRKTLTWQSVKANSLTLDGDGRPITENISIYQNSKGKYMVGIYRNIESVERLGINWALVDEIDQDEAHFVARELSSFAKISLILTTIVVLIISAVVTKRFVTPIKRISEWAKQVAHGELISRDIRVAQNEVGEMKDTFNWLVHSLQSVAEVSQSVALGDYSKQVTVRSDKDIMAISMNQMVESFKTVVKQARAIAAGDYSTNVMPRSEKDTLGIALYEMTHKLREASIEIMNQDWLKTGINELVIKISGEKSISELSEIVITFLSHYLDAQIGLLYLMDDRDNLVLSGTFAFSTTDPNIVKVSPGSGLLGQAAKEKKKLVFFATDHTLPMINIGPETLRPHHFIISPILFEEKILGAIELGSFQAFDELKQQFIDKSLETIAIALNTARSRDRVQQLLRTTQEMAKELSMQKEELGQINQELEEQAKALKMSEESLQHQQEELRVINEELEERTKVLELQRHDIRRKNEALEQAQLEIRQKAEALEAASRYKSEFLANMSHELRTPLNSILVLSEILASNKNGGMTKEEVEFSNVIHASGKDLLDLINDILDLSKVEAGKLQIAVEPMYLDDIRVYVEKAFSPITASKKISLDVEMSDDIPESIKTDPQRVMQIIKNLMSNAIKFTDHGGVVLKMYKTKNDQVAFEVKDTGIGIPEDKVRHIFEAFQQADGTISRKFGGTGLGLTISRNLTRILCGELKLKSKIGKGSVFTLILPVTFDPHKTQQVSSGTVSPDETSSLSIQTSEEPFIIPEKKSDLLILGSRKESDQIPSFSTDEVFAGKKILIVDDDMRNVYVLSKILEEKQVHILVGRNGREGLEKLFSNPDVNLVLMDIMMPEIDGYTAMQEIRKDKRFANLPIIALTAKAMKGDREKCIEAGANDYLSKPVQTEKLLTLLRVWLQK